MAMISAVLAMVIISLLMTAAVLGLARDHELTIRRSETLHAMYAAEGGMQMSLREMMEVVDEDGDGGIGTVSDDGNAANDPTFGQAQVEVTAAADTPTVGITTLTSVGRSGKSQRRLATTVE